MAILTEIDLPEYKQSLKETVAFLDDLNYSAVKTKYNAKGNWDAVSIRGYSDDITNILKPGVLKSNVEPAELRWTKLYEESALLPVKEIFEGTQDQKIKDKLIKNTSDAVEKGVFGAPSLLVDDELFFGKETLQDVEELILKKSE